jgi:hypothetical protein
MCDIHLAQVVFPVQRLHDHGLFHFPDGFRFPVELKDRRLGRTHSQRKNTRQDGLQAQFAAGSKPFETVDQLIADGPILCDHDNRENLSEPAHGLQHRDFGGRMNEAKPPETLAHLAYGYIQYLFLTHRLLLRS